MSGRMKYRVTQSWALVAALAVGAQGCDAYAPRLADPGSREQLALGLPLRTHLDSAVIPDGRYGESSQTIEDALTYLKATQKEGMLHDGSGNEIHFETKWIRKSGVIKKYPASTVVIKVAD
jgi:hypothetical protein